MVEFAITFVIFFVLLIAIIEFAMVIFDASRLAEATRAATRYAIVNDPACDIFGKEGAIVDAGCQPSNHDPLSCATSPAVSVTLALDSGSCDFSAPSPGCKIVREMDKVMMRGDTVADPWRSILHGGGEVHITYSCAGTGNPELAYPVPLVTIEAVDIKHPMMFGDMVSNQTDCNSCITLPRFETSRTGEDMYGG